MSNVSKPSGASSKVAELVKLVQSRKPSPPPIFIDGEQIQDIGELGSVTSTLGEDAAHELQSMLGVDPFEVFVKLGLVKEIQDEGSEKNLLSALEFILNDKGTDSVIKGKIAEVAHMCLTDGIEPERALQILLKLLKDSDSDVVSQTASEFNSTLESTRYPDDVLRRVAVALIETYQEHSGELGSNKVRANVVSAFGGTKSNLEKIGFLDEALSFLERAVSEQSELVKAGAANALSLIPTERSKQILAKALQNASPGDEKDFIEYRLKRVELSLVRGDKD